LAKDKNALHIKEGDPIKMPLGKHRAGLSRWSAFLIGACFAVNRVALTQSIPLGQIPQSQAPSSNQSEQPAVLRITSFLSPLKPQTLEDTYHPITSRQSVSWFITSTAGPPHLGGIALLSAGGTALNRPEEYGPHWSGFGKRYGVGMAGSALGNAIEASAGLVLREDPRYFRVSHEPFKARVGAIVRQTFSARRIDGNFEPAYARYLGIFGSNFISNAWRVQSEASAQDAILRSLEAFGGRMAADAFDEFWPDVKRNLVRKFGRSTEPGSSDTCKSPQR